MPISVIAPGMAGVAKAPGAHEKDGGGVSIELER